jgi:hypothetical protein
MIDVCLILLLLIFGSELRRCFVAGAFFAKGPQLHEMVGTRFSRYF